MEMYFINYNILTHQCSRHEKPRKI